MRSFLFLCVVIGFAVASQVFQGVCPSGFTGKDCRQKMTSDLYKCPKSCAVHGNCDAYGVCHCASGYTGSDCSVFAPMVCPMNCSSQGECDTSTKTCRCINGFQGVDCATPMLPLFPVVSHQVIGCVSGCSSRGICSHGVCFCDHGFGGDDCSFSLEVLERASAISLAINSKAEIAPRAHGSPPLPGNNNNEDMRVIDSYEQTHVHRNRIQAQAKAQEGQRTRHGGRQADSQRAVPVDGAPSDQMYACPSNCSNHGTCNTGPQGQGVCTCDSGWEGVDCGYEVTCPNNCMGHGKCDSGTCTCDAGYSGTDCSSLPSCRHRCFGHGYCVYGHCVCDPGYSGPDCREAMFCTGDCNGHGSCSQGKCACNNGFYGPDCSNKAFNTHEKGNFCPGGCNGNGVCHDNQKKCQCFRGFEGHDCGRFAHSEVPIENVVDASSPYSQPSAEDESLINTGEEGDPNAGNYPNTAAGQLLQKSGALKGQLVAFPGLEGPFPSPTQLAKFQAMHVQPDTAHVVSPPTAPVATASSKVQTHADMDE